MNGGSLTVRRCPRAAYGDLVHTQPGAVVAGPRPAGALALLAGSAVLALGAVGAPAAGRLLAAVGAAVLLAAGLRDLALRPVLRADRRGLQVVDGVRRRTVVWAAVERVRVVRDRRTPVLELDLGDALVVLSRWRLGRAPQDVLEELERLRG